MTTSIARGSLARRTSKATAGPRALGIAWIMAVAAATFSCSSGKEFPPRPQDLSGQAVLGLKMLNQHWSVGNGVPPNIYPGYTGIPQDLNDSTGGDYVWLYYMMGNADGSQGDLVSEIYTVDVTEGEGLKSAGDTQFTVNTNNNSFNTGNEIYIAFGRSDWPVVRGIAVARISGDRTYYQYFPAGIEQSYPVVWVHERKDIDPYGQPDGPWGMNAQDLNEGTSTLFYITDYIYLGYLVDQEVYDWLQR